MYKVLISAALLLSSNNLFAAKCDFAKIQNVVGVVWLQRGENKNLLDYETKLCEGDHVLTLMNSIAEFKLRDGSIITVGKESEFVFKQYELYKNANKKPNLALFELVKGAFRSITGSITKREHRYEIQTVVATMGIRGTDFWGGFGLTENGLDVMMIEGKGVYVVNPKGEQVELDKAGMGTTVFPDKSPKAPIKWGDAKVAKAMLTVTP